jgi:KTSC domain
MASNKRKLSAGWQRHEEEQKAYRDNKDINAKFAWDQLTIDFEVDVPNDVQEAGTGMATAGTTNPKRPRALAVGYNPTTKTIVIIFRDNTWWQYNNVPTDVWLGLKSAESTGRYLKESGLDSWPDMGPADVDSMSVASKTQFSDTAAKAGSIQKGMLDLKSYTAKEIFKDYL